MILTSNYLVPLEKNKDLEKMRGYINELIMSFTGRLDVDTYDLFLRESIESLSNAIALFYEGYFDAAFFLVRSGIEVSTVGIYFSDIEKGKTSASKEDWIKHKRFLMQNGLIDELKRKGSAFSELKEKVPAFFDLMRRRKELSNKKIHKQGYDSFYCVRNHPLYRQKYTKEKLVKEFVGYVRDAVGIVAVMRLVVDPLPILLSDPECKNRFPGSVTWPYSKGLVSDCIGEEILAQYKTTDFYLGWKESIIRAFPYMDEAVFDADRFGCIDVESREKLLEGLHLVSKNCACAILLTFLFSNICTIYIHGGFLIFENNGHEPFSKEIDTDLFDKVRSKGIDNYIHMPSVINDEEIVRVFLTIRVIAGEEFIIETLSPFSDDQIETLDKTVSELDTFYLEVFEGKRNCCDIKDTNIFQYLINGNRGLSY